MRDGHRPHRAVIQGDWGVKKANDAKHSQKPSKKFGEFAEMLYLCGWNLFQLYYYIKIETYRQARL